MPLPEIGNKTEKDWMGECVPMMIAEGKDQDQAVAICASAYRNKQMEGPQIKVDTLDPAAKEPPKIKSKIEILAEIKKLAEKNNLTIPEEKLMSLFSDMMEKKNAASLHVKLEMNPLPLGVEVQIFPRGRMFIEKYNKWVDFNSVLFQDMIRAFESDKLFKPFFDNEHKLGEKFGDIIDLYEKPEGLYARVDFNQQGKQAIMERKYSYISPEFGTRKDLDGIEHRNALWAVTLTNIPAFEGKIRPLQDQVRFEKINGGNRMDLKTRLAKFEGQMSTIKFADAAPMDPAVGEMLGGLVESLKEAIMKIEELTGQKQVAEEAAQTAQASLSKIQSEKAEAEKNLFFESAVKDGQLEPAELDDWRSQYDVSKDFVVKMITMRPKKASGQMSTTRTESSTTLSKEDFAIMDKQGFRNADGTYDEQRYIRDVLGK